MRMTSWTATRSQIICWATCERRQWRQISEKKYNSLRVITVEVAFVSCRKKDGRQDAYIRDKKYRRTTAQVRWGWMRRRLGEYC